MNHDPILITGGAGFIGSHLTGRLLMSGHEVVVIDDFNDYYDPRIKRTNVKEHSASRKFTLVEEDICNAEAVDRLFETYRFPMVVHLAARAGVRPSLEDPLLYERVNGIGTLNILESCRKYGCSNLIFGSSSSVYGTQSKVPFAEDDPITCPISPYATTKRANELMCYSYHHLFDINITCLRFFTVYGPRQRPEMAIHKFTRLIHSGQEIPVFGDGNAQRDYTYIDDILQGILASMSRCYPFEIINLGGHRTTSLATLIELIEKAVGKKARIKSFPDQPGDVPITYADISRAQKLLDYEPMTPITDGIGKFVDWYISTQGGKA
ncbi:MAG TPA: GDP-mannose 4,6-dehydratase [Thermoanaerobaculia bacterium]|nr:GDP-mannose 4,6-dehydratase [Thermoanaerobaculia bacterium]HUM30556.1 GDP-mannose 4,6-dehydratase [Thermoanaerobaculia bacterium]HXK68748.1 GDP-mannose 4,6-dehydratase [Thermoanaerobaculia bacterium]